MARMAGRVAGPQARDLGLGLNRKGQVAFSGALAGGQQAFTQYMGAHAGVTRKLAGLEGKRSGTEPGQDWAAMQKQYGISPTAPPGSTNPAITTPGAGGTGMPTASPPTNDPNWYQNFVSSYELPLPKELQQVSDTATANLNRLGAMPLPSYEEQFNQYQDLMNRELDKQTADLTESYGSMGARYSTDLTTAADTMRRKGIQDLAVSGTNAMTTLNSQRMGELSGTLNLLQGVGVSRANMATQAAGTAWQNYLLGTSPSEMLSAATSYAGQFSPPGSVVNPTAAGPVTSSGYAGA